MRLPPSSVYSRVVTATSLIVLATLLPVCAQAAQPLNDSPTSLVFGTVTLGQSQTEVVALTNNGKTSLTISAVSVSDSAFSVSGLALPLTLAAGQGATLNVTFSPNKTGWVYAKAVFTNAASSYLQLPLAGAGGRFQAAKASPSSLSFGNVGVGATVTAPVVLTNERSSMETLTAFRTFGNAFSVSGLALPVTLSPKQSVTINISFSPQAAGIAAGSLLVEGASLNIPLTGTGTTIGQLSLSPTSLKFGSADLGTSKTKTSTLSATGGSVTISSVACSNAQFAIAGVSFPLTINAGQSLPLQVTFTPKTASSTSATLTFISNATDSPATEPVAGTGSAPFVTLSWTPSTSQVSGYNVYRRTSPGAYSKVNSTLDPSTTYTDSTVVPGSTYYYAATAVNSSGQESGYSAPVEVVVP